MPGSLGLVAVELDYVVKNGGIGTANWGLAQLLAEHGWQVHVLYVCPVPDRANLTDARRRLAALGIGFTHIDELTLPAELQAIDRIDLFHLNLSDEAFRLKPDADIGPALPAEISSMSAGRSEAARAQALTERGGNAASDAAVASGLEWLASVQRKNGSWDFKEVGRTTGAGDLSSPTGATAAFCRSAQAAGHEASWAP